MISFPQLGQYGRLGNQLFQYAFLRFTARRLGTKFYCPEWVGDKIFDLKDHAERVSSPEGIRRVYVEPQSNCGFNPEALKISDHTEVKGFFQSEKYFTDPIEVKKWYTFRDPAVLNIKKKYSAIDFSQSVSISLRINDDYNEARGLYPLYTLGYFLQGLSRVRRKKHILVFSDNPGRAKIFFRNLNSKNIVFMDGNNAVEDLYLISLCHDNIIVNSSFAWWGAWLNGHEDKTVILPKEWFRTGNPIKISGITCEDWIALPGVRPVIDHYFVWQFQFRLRRKRKHLADSLSSIWPARAGKKTTRI